MSCADITRELLRDAGAWLEELQLLWTRIGVPEADILTRLGLATAPLKAHMNNIIKGEREMETRLLDNIATFTNELKQLSAELSVAFVEPPETLGTLELNHHLCDQLAILSQEKLKRRQQLKRLRARVGELATQLDLPTHVHISSSGVPSEKDLEELAKHLRTLKEEKNTRQLQLSSLRKEICRLVEALQVSPDTTLEHEVVGDGQKSLDLSQSYLSSVKDYLQRLRALELEKGKEHVEVRDRLFLNWDALDVPQEDRDLFLDQHSQYTPAVLNRMKEELARCESLVVVQLEEYVAKLKFYTPKWKSGGSNDSEASEKPHGQPAEELKQLKALHLQNKAFFEKVERREVLWERLVKLEDRTDPACFNNRGGVLLKQEAERKKLQRVLPRVEKELASYIDMYQGDSVDAFKIWSEGFRRHLDVHSSARQGNKENSRAERGRGQELSRSSHAGTPRGTKRHASASPGKHISKLRIGLPSSAAFRPSPCKSAVKGMKGGPAGTVQARKVQQLVPSNPLAAAGCSTPLSPLTSQSQATAPLSLETFVEDLKNKPPSWRSTLVPQEDTQT